MIDLTDKTALAAADPGGMLADVLGSGGQLAKARAAAKAAVSDLPNEVARIVYLGMGGSGISGDALAALAAPVSPIPVTVVKGYDLPAFAEGEDTLVIACSYSGSTEETLSAFDQATKRSCTRVVVSSGGELSRLAREQSIPLLEIPTGIQPRAAFPSLLAATLTIGERVGALGSLDKDFDSAAATIKESVAEADPSNGGGFPNELSERFHGRHVHIWGMSDLASVVASRWRAQIQENAQAPASNADLPELDHNEIMSYDPGEKAAGQTCLVILRHDFEHPRVALRAEITLELIKERIADSVMIRTHAQGALATLCDLIVTGDLASVYLALRRGVDPSPVPSIATLKSRLAQA